MTEPRTQQATGAGATSGARGAGPSGAVRGGPPGRRAPVGDGTRGPVHVWRAYVAFGFAIAAAVAGTLLIRRAVTRMPPEATPAAIDSARAERAARDRATLPRTRGGSSVPAQPAELPRLR